MTQLRSTLLLFAFIASLAQAQPYTYVPTDVSTTAGTFNTTTPVGNLIWGLHAGVRSTTPFAYETTSQFTLFEIGYIAAWNTPTGTLTFTMPQPVTVDRAYLWNAYFSIEADHSIQNTQLRFYDESNALVGTVSHAWPICNLAVLTGDSLVIDPPIADVARVEVDVQTLHGGNDISLRRIAFAGPTLITGLGDARVVQAAVFPNPAADAITVFVVGALQVQLFDAEGRAVQAPVQRQADRMVMDVSALAPGTYHARISTATGTAHAQVVVAR